MTMPQAGHSSATSPTRGRRNPHLGQLTDTDRNVPFLDPMIVLTALVAVLVFLLLVAEQRRSRRSVWVLKPLASLAFLATALSADGHDSAYGRMIGFALFLSLVGDVLLIPRGRRPFFLGGLGAFLAAHVAFAAAFVVAGVDWKTVGLLALPLAVLGFGVGRWLRPSVDPPLRTPVIVYIVVITGMVVLAGGCLGDGQPALIPIAAVVFFLSDLSVAVDRFKGGGFTNRLWGLPAYYCAQVAFAWTIPLVAVLS
ncbi:MAG: lysoplasmalogenase [Myxococcota bacterium]|nr:lysoplasmalogenase [Myxococcota bacterium]